jgi:uncharacterized protein YfaS (alpha-2-macroglobulin family)
MAGFRLANTSKGLLYVELSLSGNSIEQQPAKNDVIELSRTMYTADGHPISGRQLRVGETVLVRVVARSKTEIGNGLIVDRIPAGLEIENLNLVRGEQMDLVLIDGINPGQAMNDRRIRHVEFRDDRFVAAVHFTAAGSYLPFPFNRNNGALELFYRARVVTPGEFVTPPLYAEDTYRPNISGLTGGTERITVADGK